VSGGNRDYAQEMAMKAAEAHALRRAFDVTGLPALDEQRPEQPSRRVTAADIAPQQPAQPEPVDGVLVDPDADAAEQAAAEPRRSGQCPARSRLCGLCCSWPRTRTTPTPPTASRSSAPAAPSGARGGAAAGTASPARTSAP